MDTSSPIGVIFDMDGVLVDSAAAHLRSWQLPDRPVAREFERIRPALLCVPSGLCGGEKCGLT